MNPAMNCSSPLDIAAPWRFGLPRCLLMQQRPYFPRQSERSERLGQVQRGASVEYRGAAAAVIPGSEDHDRHVAETFMASDETQHLEAVHVGHVQVEDDQRDRAECQLLDRL